MFRYDLDVALRAKNDSVLARGVRNRRAARIGGCLSIASALRFLILARLRLAVFHRLEAAAAITRAWRTRIEHTAVRHRGTQEQKRQREPDPYNFLFHNDLFMPLDARPRATYRLAIVEASKRPLAAFEPIAASICCGTFEAKSRSLMATWGDKSRSRKLTILKPSGRWVAIRGIRHNKDNFNRFGNFTAQI